MHGRITGPAKNKAIEENAARQEIMDHLVFNRSGRQMKGGVPQSDPFEDSRAQQRILWSARYNIVDADDLSTAKEFMERPMQAAEAVTEV